MTTTEETTVAQLAELVENYYGLSERIAKLEKTKDMTRKLIVDAFAYTGMSAFTTPSGLVASVTGIGDPMEALWVSQSEADKPTTDRLLDINRHFQSQG